MQSSDFQRDEVLKAKRQEVASGPRGDRPHRRGWASVLGNAAVQRLLRSLGVQRAGAGPHALDDSIARAIQSKRGTGRSLDSGAQREMEGSLGEDFSGVRVHTDAEADTLSRAVHAEAFTTGRDIFFREGKYSPGSTEGRKLLAHELAHVVQQRGAPSAQDLTVSSPEDASERQASAVAERLSGSGTPAAVSRQVEEKDEELAPSLQRQEEEAPEEPEEEEEEEEEKEGEAG